MLYLAAFAAGLMCGAMAAIAVKRRRRALFAPRLRKVDRFEIPAECVN